MPTQSGALDSSAIETLLERVVTKVVSIMQGTDCTAGHHRLAYTEPEAAALLGVKSHVLRDARRRRMINHTRVGGRIAYTRQHLMDYLESQSA